LVAAARGAGAVEMEIEAKLGVPDGLVLGRLARVRTLAGFDLVPRRAGRLRDTYVDTRERLLLAAGFACRRRMAADGLRYTLKALGGVRGAVHRREELEVRLPVDAPPVEWPRGRARTRVLAIIGKEPLEPLVTLEQRRRTRTVLAGRRVVAELALDAVRVPSRRRAPRVFHELEVELRHAGTERDLGAMVAALKERWGLTDVSESKLARALALVSGRKPVGPGSRRAPGKRARRKRPGLRPADPMAEAARRTLAVHFGRMLDHEPGTRLGQDPEELHDMRVATRRMRAGLRLFAAHFEPKILRAFRKGLRRTGQVLGAVRDLDVFNEKTARYLEGLPEDRRGELGPLLEVWGRARETARKELLGYLDGEDYRTLCERIAEFLSTPGAGAAAVVGGEGEPLPHEVRHVVPSEIYRHYGEVLAFDAPLAAPAPPLSCYHLLRITAKGLRYTLEFFEEVLGKGAKQLIEEMKALQDHLGNLQDAVVASTLLSNFLSSGQWGTDRKRGSAPIQVAPGVAAYLAARQSELQALLEGFPPVWRRVRGREFGERLGTLAAALALSGRSGADS